MFVCCVCCQVEVSATSWSLVQRSPTDCGASSCEITKPRGPGGHSPRWAAEPEKIINNNSNNKIRGQVVVAWLEVLPRHLPGEIEGNHVELTRLAGLRETFGRKDVLNTKQDCLPTRQLVAMKSGFGSLQERMFVVITVSKTGSWAQLALKMRSGIPLPGSKAKWCEADWISCNAEVKKARNQKCTSFPKIQELRYLKILGSRKVL
jgi:hypothetical protein